MAIGISALAFAVRKQGASLPKPVGHGHAQQLLAAALGYKSLAAYQASQEEEPDLSPTKHIVLDEALLLQRAGELGLPYSGEVIVSLVIDALTNALPHANVHRTKGAFDDMLRDYIDDAVLRHDETVGQMAMSNGTLGEVYLPFETLLEDIPYDDVKEFSIIGQVSMRSDVERPYVGHVVHVSASLFLTRYGKVCVGEPQCRVNSAKLAWFGDDGSEGEGPTVSLANAIAEELGIDLEDAEALTDAEILVNESNDGGLVYSYTLYAEPVASPELAAKLLRKFDSLDIELPADFYDGVTWSPYD
ncbi:peptide ABC transporter permease [Burkholderia pseudomallei]|uniref:peptide ABC transporter permease n=1 Tax=Burkholderia pseudomallei TaxID=28450 RepID=UPI0021F69EC7|nr:peptide ABC transporter permease [Burkholderia pseudomallei]MCW0048889.1 peptide ABC transporter permease [Burkholderia pseudomallei]